MGWAPFLVGLGVNLVQGLLANHQSNSAADKARKAAEEEQHRQLIQYQAMADAHRRAAVAAMTRDGISPEEANQRALAGWPAGPAAGQSVGDFLATVGYNSRDPNQVGDAARTPGIGGKVLTGALGSLPMLFNPNANSNPAAGFAGGTDSTGTQWNTPASVPGSHMSGSQKPTGVFNPTSTGSPTPTGTTATPDTTASAATPGSIKPTSGVPGVSSPDFLNNPDQLEWDPGTQTYRVRGDTGGINGVR